ncbi:MAG: hypothetical protein ACJA1H_001584 [Glaciecola sp.]|jgi:hypothetical protein
MKNKLDLVQMELSEKNKTLEHTFFYNTLYNLSSKIDDLFFELSDDEKGPFLKWMELEFISNRLLYREVQLEGMHRFADPTEAYAIVNAQKQKIDYLQDWIKEKKASLITIKRNETEGKLASLGSYLGQPTNDLANNLFDFLILYYRPDQKTKVKYINILHYLKNDSNKELYVFNVKQVDYIKMIKEKTGIQIKKFQKSERYLAIEKPVLNALEVTFRT